MAIGRTAVAAGCDLPDLAEECLLVGQYAVDVKYPSLDPTPDEAVGRRVVAAARRIGHAVRDAMDRVS
jgi:hypothetical protein